MRYTQFFNSKLHRFTVTEANMNYTGSITIDKVLMSAAGIKPLERVQVLNINTGDRLETYVIEGEPNSGVICLNGAAARKFQPGDKCIIISYVLLTPEEQVGHKAVCVIALDDTNLNFKQEFHSIFKERYND